MRWIVLFAAFTFCCSVSCLPRQIPNAHFCSTYVTKHNRADVYARNFRVKKNRWAGGIVYYELDHGLTGEEMKLIDASIHDLTSQTCIRWVKRQRGETPYVLITNKHGGCWAELGLFEGRDKTTLNLQKDYCWAKYIVTHEMLHIMGMDHEQNRPDRDSYVKINWQNIYPGMEYNFYKDKIPGSNTPICHLNPEIKDKSTCSSSYETETFGLPYDTKSIMHYEGLSFSKSDEPTIVPLQSSEPLETNMYLTRTDLLKINTAYCDGRPFPTPGPIPCEDLYGSCEGNEYLCTAHIEYARKNCKRTCNFCES